MLANTGDEAVPFELEVSDEGGRGAAIRCRLTDETHTWEEAPLPAGLSPHAILLVDFPGWSVDKVNASLAR